MHKRITRKSFLSMKEMIEGHKQWLLDYGWSLDYMWHKKDHKSCTVFGGGMWMLQGYGFYQGADGLHRLYTSHRCSACGTMVQHNQMCTYDGAPEGDIQRLIVTP